MIGTSTRMLELKTTFAAMAASPMSSEDIERYRATAAAAEQYAYAWLRRQGFLLGAIILCGLAALTWGVSVNVISTPFRWGFLMMLMSLTAFVTIAVHAGGHGAAKHPMSLLVDGVEMAFGEADFSPIEIDPTKLAGDPQGQQLLARIAELGRQPVGFERRLLQARLAL